MKDKKVLIIGHGWNPSLAAIESIKSANPDLVVVDSRDTREIQGSDPFVIKAPPEFDHEVYVHGQFSDGMSARAKRRKEAREAKKSIKRNGKK